MSTTPANGCSPALRPLWEPVSDPEFVPKNLLITGGAGFIASHVVIRLAKLYPDYKVRDGEHAIEQASHFCMTAAADLHFQLTQLLLYCRWLCLTSWTTAPA